MKSEVGRERSRIGVAGLVDTNILFCWFDKRFPVKHAIATEMLRALVAERSLVPPRQVVAQFVSVV